MLNDIGKLLGDLNLVLQKSRVKEHESYSKGEKFNAIIYYLHQK